MLHVAPPPSPHQVALEHDVRRARDYIAAVRRCGLVIVPWRCFDDATGVAIFDGQDDAKQFDPPAREGNRDIVFKLLCDDYGVDPNDPHLSYRINEKLRAAYPVDEQVLS